MLINLMDCLLLTDDERRSLRSTPISIKRRNPARHAELSRIGRATDDRRPTTDDRRPTTDDRRPTTDDPFTDTGIRHDACSARGA
jgi:hypothetical protein